MKAKSTAKSASPKNAAAPKTASAAPKVAALARSTAKSTHKSPARSKAAPKSRLITPEMLDIALKFQQDEIDDYCVYKALEAMHAGTNNAKIFAALAADERKHAMFWEGITGRTLMPRKFKIWRTIAMARVFGFTFTMKRLEKNELKAAKNYALIAEDFPEVTDFAREEERHEQRLLSMLDEEMLRYVGSMVLGLNDALVELTGSLAGFTLALGQSNLILIAGLVTGVSAAFSMAASEYLSNKADDNPDAIKSALYTGLAYFITVILLILPFVLFASKFAALACTLIVAVVIIFVFNFYLSVAKDFDFRTRFAQMAGISLSVAALSFVIGYLLNIALKV
jgi:VIT1/CCC1 family predicted Fe2+/Mn2+ transporter